MPEQMTKQDAIETLEIFRNDYTREGSEICRAIDIAIDALKQPEQKPTVQQSLDAWADTKAELDEESKLRREKAKSINPKPQEVTQNDR